MADVSISLQWSGTGLQFDGGAADRPHIHLDGDGVTGPSPMQTLLLALAGCMGADVVDISTKSRATMTSLLVRIEGDRAAEPPRRYTSIAMRFVAGGVPEADRSKVQRALDLSHEKYCSVMHSLRQDMVFASELQFT